MDEDGFPADDIFAIENLAVDSIARLFADSSIEVMGINFSAYGASWIYVDESGK